MGGISGGLASSSAGTLTNYSSGTNASIPVVALVTSLSNLGSNLDVSLVPNGTGAFQLVVPDGTTVGGNKRGTNAVDLQGPSQRTAATQVASGANSITFGTGNTASGTASIAGGSGCVASSSWSIGLGYLATASGQQSLALGNSVTASGQYASALGGAYNTASGKYSTTVGGYQATTNGIAGQVAFGHYGTSSGQYQHTLTQVYANTTSTTATVATADGNSGATSNQLTLRTNSAFYVRARAVARDATNNTDAAAWYADLLVIRGSTAAATSIVGSPAITQQYASSGATGWTLAFAADTTNGALKATVTSTTTDTVRWNVSFDAIEVN